MAIDPNILPQMGTYKGLKYSKRYSDLIPNQAGFVQTDAETGRKSWYQGNAFTTYVGGEGILASSWERVIYANTLISCSPAAEEHPVNISMAVMDTAGTLRSGSIRTTGGGSSYIPGYSCPVLDFDATKICIAIRIYVADIGGSDPESEGWTTTELDLKAIMTNNPTYAGLFEKGYTEDGKFLVGFTPLFYIDGGSGRAYDGRISLVVENSAPGRDSWNTLENIYFFFNFATSQSFKRMVNIWADKHYDYSQSMNTTRAIDDSNLMIMDGNGGVVGNIGSYEINCNNFANGYRIIEGTNYVYKKSRYSNKDYVYFGRFYTGEQILRTMAATGLYFSVDSTKAANATIGENTTDDDIYIGLMTSEGYTTGEYVNGVRARNVPQASWTHAIEDAGNNGYIPTNPTQPIPATDPTNYDKTNSTIFGRSVTNACSNVYALGFDSTTFKPKLEEALEYLFTDVLQNADLEYSIKNFLGTSPIDCIQGVVIYPIDIIPTVIPAEQAPLKNICFGNIESDVQGRVLPVKASIVDMGYIDIYRKFGDFRDYAPYTSLTLVLPYCGQTTLDNAAFMGKRLNMKYIIDWTSGACSAVLLADNLAIQTVNGQIGVSIPLTGLQTAQIAQAVEAAQLRHRESLQNSIANAASLTVGAASGGLLGRESAQGAITGSTGVLMNITRAGDRLEYDLSHIPEPVKTVGGSSSGIGMLLEQRPRLIISRPKMLDGYDAEIFSRTQGNACCLTAALGSLPGYVQVSNADLSGIPASEAEKAAILSLLKNGIFM